MQLFWNGEMASKFKPMRGIRQGDPLSPYLFVLCIEKLNHMIHRVVDNGEWKPAKITRSGPRISHMFFTDDIVLVDEASVAQLRFIQSLLNKFCEASGQRVNIRKSELFVSPNVENNLVERLKVECGFNVTRNLGSYLSMPVLHKKATAEDFAPLLDKINAKLASWKSRHLNFTSRLTLTKSVLSSIPVYSMVTMVLPSDIYAKIDSICGNFVWGANDGRKIMHMVA